MKNFGRLGFRTIVIEGRSYGLPVIAATDTPWKDVAPEPANGVWFIAVMPNGVILSCEADPMQSLVVSNDVDIDIWQIEHPGPADTIRTNRWDGEKVVPITVEPE